MFMSKKILVLTPRFPYPVIGGDKLRIYYICKELKRAGFELTLISFVEDEKEKEAVNDNIFAKIITVRLPKWRSYLNTEFGIFSKKPLQISYYRSKKMQDAINEMLARAPYDGVLVHLIRMAPYALSLSSGVPNISVPISSDIGLRKIRFILEMTDAISLNYERNRKQSGRGLMGLIYRIEENRVRKYEKLCLEKFDASVVVSKIDAAYLNQSTENKYKDKLQVMGNGVMENFLKSETRERDPNVIVFEGNLRTHQNEDAILYFVSNIYPLIKREIAGVRFRIVGANPSSKISRLNSKNGIEVTGEVSDVKAELSKAAVSVAPMRIVAGVQNKVLESMVTGTAVIGTTVAFSGIPDAKEGEHYIKQDDPKEFAKAIVTLMRDESKRKSIGEAGKKLVSENYTFDRQLAGYSELFL